MDISLLCSTDFTFKTTDNLRFKKIPFVFEILNSFFYTLIKIKIIKNSISSYFLQKSDLTKFLLFIGNLRNTKVM